MAAMAGCRRRARACVFPLEKAQPPLVGEATADHLERDEAARVVLLRLVHGAHAAFADAAEDPEGADGAPGGGGGRLFGFRRFAVHGGAVEPGAVLDEAPRLAMRREQGLGLFLEARVAGAGLGEER